MTPTPTNTYTITATNHDSGSPAVSFDRTGRERAEWSRDLLLQCGYRIVTIDQHIEWSV